jgi:hypothetical protein
LEGVLPVFRQHPLFLRYTELFSAAITRRRLRLASDIFFAGSSTAPPQGFIFQIKSYLCGVPYSHNIMETKKTTTAKAKNTAPVKASAKAKGKKDEFSEGWYIDERGIRIPLSEFFKDDPKPTGPKRTDVLRELGYFPLIEIVDMRAVLK